MSTYEIIQNREQPVKLASHGKRIANYFIDTICIYLVSAGIGVVLAIVILLFFGEASLDYDENNPGNRLLEMIFGLILFFAYYTFMEHVFKGKTIGKMITKTSVVRKDNTELDLDTIAIRSISRFVPFEAFSFLGNKPIGWHDRWSKTLVVEDNPDI